MTLEYVLLLLIGALVFMSTLLKAPSEMFNKGGARLAARVETQIATGHGFKPFSSGASASDDKRVKWTDKTQ